MDLSKLFNLLHIGSLGIVAFLIILSFVLVFAVARVIKTDDEHNQ